MESLVDKMKYYIDNYYDTRYKIERMIEKEKTIQDIKNITEQLYIEEKGYKGPFIEQVAPGLYKIQTSHVKMYGGQGVVDEIEKILKESESFKN